MENRKTLLVLSFAEHLFHHFNEDTFPALLKASFGSDWAINVRNLDTSKPEITIDWKEIRRLVAQSDACVIDPGIHDASFLFFMFEMLPEEHENRPFDLNGEDVLEMLSSAYDNLVNCFESLFDGAQRKKDLYVLKIPSCEVLTQHGEEWEKSHCKRLSITSETLNDAIIRCCQHYRLTTVDLDALCSERKDYHSPLEFLEPGIKKIADHMAGLVLESNFKSPPPLSTEPEPVYELTPSDEEKILQIAFVGDGATSHTGGNSFINWEDPETDPPYTVAFAMETSGVQILRYACVEDHLDDLARLEKETTSNARIVLVIGEREAKNIDCQIDPFYEKNGRYLITNILDAAHRFRQHYEKLIAKIIQNRPNILICTIPDSYTKQYRPAFRVVTSLLNFQIMDVAKGYDLPVYDIRSYCHEKEWFDKIDLELGRYFCLSWNAMDRIERMMSGLLGVPRWKN